MYNNVCVDVLGRPVCEQLFQRQILQTPHAYNSQKVQWRRKIQVPMQFVQNGQLHPQQLIWAVGRAVVLYEVFHLWN